MQIRLVYILFMLSGCTSLVFEVIWFQWLELIFGSTTLAISTILVAYMLGLGVGALCAGHIIGYFQNGVRTYGAIEITIGFYALFVPTLVALYPEINVAITGSMAFELATVIRFLLSLAVFLVPTFLMGATLPIVIHALTHNASRLVHSVATLYAVNTGGAVVGVLVTTFVLLPMAGLFNTNMMAAFLSMVTGSIAIFLIAPKFARNNSRGVRSTPKKAALLGHVRGRRLLLTSFAFVGASGLAYEVCWSRALGMVFGSSIYAFSITLATFLAGIAAGSMLTRKYVKAVSPGSNSYIAGLVLLAVISYAVTALLPQMPDMLNGLFMRFEVSTTWLMIGLLQAAAFIMFVPAVLLGAMFPLLINAFESNDKASGGAAVGGLYFTNTIGAAIGAFVAGFVLIPVVGIAMTVALTATALMLSAAVLLLQKKSMQPSVIATGITVAAVLALVVPPSWNPTSLTAGVYQNPYYYQGFGIETVPLQGLKKQGLLYYKEGVNSTVSVHRLDGSNLDMRINGKTDASLGDMSTQVLMGEIPPLFGGVKTGRYLVIGLASGVTTGSITLHQPSHVDVLELEPAVIEASRYFDEYNNRPLDNRRVRVIADDARAIMGTVSEPYDVIISEPSNPWLSGASSLFTKEFFQATKTALKDDGVLMQWLQLYWMDMSSVQAILSALKSEFPYLYGFLAHKDDTDLLILARQTPLNASDLPRWRSLSRTVQHDLNRINLYSTADLLSLMRLTPQDFEQIIGDNQIENTDDNMFVALRSPWHLFDSSDEVLASFQPDSEGVLAIDNSLSANEIAALALSHMWTRNDLVMAARTAAVALRAGESANGRVFTAELRSTAYIRDNKKIRSRLDRAVQLDPNGYMPRVARANFFYDTGDNEKALEDVQVALSVEPEYWPARRLKLDLLTEMGRYEEARTEADILLKSPYRQVDEEIWADAAQVAVKVGRLSDGAEKMSRYLQIYPYSPEEWSWLESVYRRLGQDQNASVAATNVTLSKRNLIRDEHRDARYLEQIGERDEAIASLEDLIKRYPSYEMARADLVRLKVSENQSIH